jgi:hypothetical protein
LATPIDYELSILKHVIFTGDVDIDSKYLTGDRKVLYKALRSYYDSYSSIPSADTLRAIAGETRNERLYDVYISATLAEDYDIKFSTKKLSDEYYERLIKYAVESYNDSKKDSKKEKFEDFIGFLLTERQDTAETPQGYVWESSIDRWDKYLQREANPMHMQGVPTHIAPFDKHLGGAVDKRFNVLVGLAKSGKTTMLMNIADNLADKSDQHVLYISGEMPKEELEMIIDAKHSMIDSMLIRNGSLSEALKKKFRSMYASQWERKANLYIIEPEPNFTVQDVLSYIRMYEKKYNPKTSVKVMIDYLWKMEVDRKYGGSWDKLDYLTEDIYTIICKRLGYNVWSCTHEGLEGAKRKRDGKERSVLETVQGSSRIVPNVSALILQDTYLKEEELTNKMLLKCDANRHGASFSEYVTYLKEFSYIGSDIVDIPKDVVVEEDRFQE